MVTPNLANTLISRVASNKAEVHFSVVLPTTLEKEQSHHLHAVLRSLVGVIPRAPTPECNHLLSGVFTALHSCSPVYTHL